MSDQVYSAPQLNHRISRLKCKKCNWEGNLKSCPPKGRPVPKGIDEYMGATGHHCPECDTLLAILGGYGFFPTHEAEVTFPWPDEDYIHVNP